MISSIYFASMLGRVLKISAPLTVLLVATKVGAFALLPPCAGSGSCSSLDDILQVFANVAQVLLGITGSLVLLMFIWGGAEWVFSMGSSEMVTSGRERMKNAVFGIIIVFSALAFVRTLQTSLGITDSSGVALIDEYRKCSGANECGFGYKCDSGVCVPNGEAAGTDSKCETDLNCTTVGQVCSANKCVWRCVKASVPPGSAPAGCAPSCTAPDKVVPGGANLCPNDKICCFP